MNICWVIFLNIIVVMIHAAGVLYALNCGLGSDDYLKILPMYFASLTSILVTFNIAIYNVRIKKIYWYSNQTYEGLKTIITLSINNDSLHDLNLSNISCQNYIVRIIDSLPYTIPSQEKGKIHFSITPNCDHKEMPIKFVLTNTIDVYITYMINDINKKKTINSPYPIF